MNSKTGNAGTFSPLFQPGKIGNVKTRNRIVMLPMGTAFGTQFGAVTERTIKHYVERAKGGAGLITVGNISPSAPNVFNQLSLRSDWLLMGHYELVEKVHEHGAKITAQLNLAGRQKYPEGLTTEEEIYSSSALKGSLLGQDYPVPKALNKEEIKQVLGLYVDAAERAKKVGYDIIELHGAHGYLINQFLSPFMNRRTDEYGGSLENRMRFVLEMIALIKERVGADFPIGVRISGEEFVPNGITLKESTIIVKRLEEAGVSYISATAGTFESFDKFADAMRDPEGWKEYLWEAIKKAVNIPVLAGGGLRHPELCARLIKENKADYIGFARPLLADPEWPLKVQQGRPEDVRLCIFCNECIFGSASRRQGGGARRCTVNANMGRDYEFATLKAAPQSKKVMVVGGGVAGLEAARIAALRGHRVTVFEKNDFLGGQTFIASKIKSKYKLQWFCDYLLGQLKKLNVEIRTGVEVDAELVKSFEPDSIVFATGAKSAMLPIPGSKKENVLSGIGILENDVEISNKKVAVIGGGLIGCEIAEHLTDMGNEVSIVEILEDIALGMEPVNRHALLKTLNENNVNVLANKETTKITENGIQVRCKKTGQEQFVEADLVVMAVGTTPEQQLLAELEGEQEYYVAGDCVKPRNIMEAVYEGSLAGRKI